MTSPAKLNEFNHAEKPARVLLEKLGWTYVPREALAAEQGRLAPLYLKVGNGGSGRESNPPPRPKGRGQRI